MFKAVGFMPVPFRIWFVFFIAGQKALGHTLAEGSNKWRIACSRLLIVEIWWLMINFLLNFTKFWKNKRSIGNKDLEFNGSKQKTIIRAFFTVKNQLEEERITLKVYGISVEFGVRLLGIFFKLFMIIINPYSRRNQPSLVIFLIFKWLGSL